MTNHNRNFGRRGLLKGALGALAGASALGVAKIADAETCTPETPKQTLGPFYPVMSQADTDWDLTHIQGRHAGPLGKVIYVVGTVTDNNCDPVAGALVEIWQACASGRYNHPGDTSGLPLDQNFQYWGRALTDAAGQYKFKTVIPGDYPADDHWQRPPHIHYKVTKRAYRELVTQMYFEGNPLNDDDQILQGVPANERPSVVRPVEDPRPDLGFDQPWVRFDLGMHKIARR